MIIKSINQLNELWALPLCPINSTIPNYEQSLFFCILSIKDAQITNREIFKKSVKPVPQYHIKEKTINKIALHLPHK